MGQRSNAQDRCTGTGGGIAAASLARAGAPAGGWQHRFRQAYMDGDWSSPDIAALLELAARNQSARSVLRTASRWPVRLLHRLQHQARANTPDGSRRNIAAHYDLSNDFYASWLDAGMSYSSATVPRIRRKPGGRAGRQAGPCAGVAGCAARPARAGDRLRLGWTRGAAGGGRLPGFRRNLVAGPASPCHRRGCSGPGWRTA